MSVFGDYSQYYDLLYRDKDYAGEARFIAGLIERERAGSKSLLDLGCGTGRHDFLLGEHGYQVTGVDISHDMLRVAQAEREERLTKSPNVPRFEQGDVRSVRLAERFDVVVSLFHVMSYQTSNEDLVAGLRTLREHCKPDGLVLFDAWYGPAVLSDKPSVRHKQLRGNGIEVLRLADPVLHANDNVVDVNYRILITDEATQRTRELRETHRMRYLFVPEVRHVLESVGLRLSRACEFMSEGELGVGTWNALFVARPL